jgi:hypothetical protein
MPIKHAILTVAGVLTIAISDYSARPVRIND